MVTSSPIYLFSIQISNASTDSRVAYTDGIPSYILDQDYEVSVDQGRYIIDWHVFRTIKMASIKLNHEEKYKLMCGWGSRMCNILENEKVLAVIAFGADPHTYRLTTLPSLPIGLALMTATIRTMKWYYRNKHPWGSAY